MALLFASVPFWMLGALAMLAVAGSIRWLFVSLHGSNDRDAKRALGATFLWLIVAGAFLLIAALIARAA